MIRLVLVLSPGVSCLTGALIGWVIDWSIDQFTPRYFRQPEWTPPVRPAAAAASRAPKPFRTHRRSVVGTLTPPLRPPNNLPKQS